MYDANFDSKRGMLRVLDQIVEVKRKSLMPNLFAYMMLIAILIAFLPDLRVAGIIK